MTYVIGLTGGIGSGKTLVSDHFASLEVPIIDTDIIARQIVEPGHEALAELTTYFGDNILLADGQLNRSELRSLAFASPKNKQALDNITHPAIRKETAQQIALVTDAYCLVVIPLLNKSSPFFSFLQRVLVVTANRDTKIERVKKRSNLTKQEVVQIMETQLDDTERLSFADDVIANDSTIEDAYEQVEKLHQTYLTLARTG